MACFSTALFALALALGDELPAPTPTPAQHARIRELIEVVANPKLVRGDANWGKAQRAGDELAGMGAVAAPYLIRALAEPGPGDRIPGGPIVRETLMAIGRPAVGSVRLAWPTLGAKARSALMHFRGRYDYAAALPYWSLNWFLVASVADPNNGP